MDLTFDESVKRQKAVEWLIDNDATIRAAAMYARQSPVAAILVGAEYGQTFASKVDEVAERMTVTDEERAWGYPLPRDEAERQRRAEVQLNVERLASERQC